MLPPLLSLMLLAVMAVARIFAPEENCVFLFVLSFFGKRHQYLLLCFVVFSFLLSQGARHDDERKITSFKTYDEMSAATGMDASSSASASAAGGAMEAGAPAGGPGDSTEESEFECREYLAC